MSQFKRLPGKLVAQGLDLRHPIDMLAPGKYPILGNLRANRIGELTLRQTLANVSGSALDQTPLHSVRRLNNSLPLYPTGGSALLPYTRVVGSGTKLYSGAAALTEVDTGYSGNPLSLVPFQPVGSQDAWMYVADSLRMRKVRGNSGQTDYPMGIAPPTIPVTSVIGQPYYVPVTAGATGFTPTGTAGAVTTPTRFNTTVAAIKYDGAFPDWACIAPTVMDDSIQPGAFCAIDGDYIIIREVFEAITDTTIASITYDSGTSGLCTIVLTASSSGLRPNAMIRLAAAEYVRVITVSSGPNPGQISFRCITTGTRAATNAVTGVKSFRAFLSHSYTAGATLVGNVNQSTVTVGTGYLTLVGALDLSTLFSTHPVQVDDYMHISVYVDNPDNVVEGRFELDIDGATNDFTKNYLYKAFRADDLQSNVSSLLTVPTAQQVAVQRQILGDNDLNPEQQSNPGVVLSYDNALPPDSGQGIYTDGESAPSSVLQTTGTGQWTEILVKISELVRVGNDQSRGLKNVASIRVQLQVSASTVLRFGSWWIGGSFGRDVGQVGSPLLHTYRYKSSLTGAVSNPAPVVRSGVNPKRDYVRVSFTASTDPQVDLIEIFSFGAGLDSWKKVAEVPNATSSFDDTVSTRTLEVALDLRFDKYQPFPTTDIPRAGTCAVVGTAITNASGDTFNTSWAPGSIINIGGFVTTVYSVPSTTLIFIQDSLGNLGTVPFNLPGATIQNQPLPCMWGPFGGSESGLYNFAVGDPNDPGLVYWTNANDPDSASDQGYISVTSPSEPMMNGFTSDGRSIAFSSERLFSVIISLNGPNRFTFQEIANGTGLFARWAFCFRGTKFWYLSKSGIYESGLSSMDAGVPITDEDLYPLFPHEGAPQSLGPINGVYYPPDFTVTAKLRLTCDEDSVYFIYQDTQGTMRCLRYDLSLKGWFPEDYTPQLLTVYKEEGDGVESVVAGGNDGILYKMEQGTADAGTAIACRLRTMANDAGDSRGDKYWGDVMMDYAADGADILIASAINNFASAVAPSTTITGSARIQTPVDLVNGAGVLGRNLGLDISWSSSTARPVLYEWQPSVVDKPELSLKRATDWDEGEGGTRYMRAVLIEADTKGKDRTINILGDGGADMGEIRVNQSGQMLMPYALTPFNCHLVKLQPTDENEWQLFRALWIYDPYPELAPITGKWTHAGRVGAKFVQGIKLTADTSGQNVTVQIQGDEEEVKASITANHQGKSNKPYSWEPFIASMLRTVPENNARIWDEPETEWVWEPAPELTSIWKTQGTTHDLAGWQHSKDLYIALISNGPVQFRINVDDQYVLFMIPSTEGVYRKVYINEMIFESGVYPLKGKIWDYSLTGGPLRVFERDMQIMLKSWGSSGGYMVKQPIGDVHREHGALI